jgi:hypothetical protein
MGYAFHCNEVNSDKLQQAALTDIQSFTRLPGGGEPRPTLKKLEN